MLFDYKRADFWLPNFGFKDHFSGSMFDGLFLPWQQICHIFIQFLEQLLKFLVNFTLLKYVSLRVVNAF